MFRYFAAAAITVMALALARPAPAAEQQPAGVIGTIMEVEGSATVTPAGAKAAKPAAIKDYIHMNDVVETAAASRVLILFIDDTQITLSEKSKVTVNEYVFDPDNKANNKAKYSFLQGTFQYVSGLISKKPDPDVSINTPYGTLGIRGTKLWAGSLKDSYGVHVDEGLVSVRNNGGQVLVNKGQGTKLKSLNERPADAVPWQMQEMAFIASTVLLKNQAAVLQRIIGFQGQQNVLRGQFQNFLKLKGMPGGLNLPGGGDLPFKEKKGNRRGGSLPFSPNLPGGFKFP